GSDHRLLGGPAYALGAALGRHAVVAADTGDKKPEHDGLSQPHEHVSKAQCLVGGGPILVGVEPQQEVRDNKTTGQSYQVRDNAEEKHHHHTGHHARRHQLLGGIHSHGAHGVDLLAHLHGAQFAGHSGGVTASHHQSGQHRTEFPHHGKRHQLAG